MENKLKGLDHNNMGYLQQFNQVAKESAKKIQDRNERERVKVYVTDNGKVRLTVK